MMSLVLHMLCLKLYLGTWSFLSGLRRGCSRLIGMMYTHNLQPWKPAVGAMIGAKRCLGKFS